MATNVPIPNLGDSISQVTLLRWLKNDGDYVRVDDALVELETDKANTELQAQAAGVLKQTRKVGETVKVGEVVASIDETAAAPAAKAVESKPADGGASVATAASQGRPAQPQAAASASAGSASTSVPAPAAASATPKPPAGAESESAELADLNPSVRPLIVEHNLNPKDIPATGPHGRLLKEDVLAYLEKKGKNGRGAPTAAAPTVPVAKAVEARPVEPAAPRPPIPAAPTATRPPSSDKPTEADYDAKGEARIAMSKIRLRTALNLKEAQNTAAILTTFNEVDMTAIMDLRTRYKERFEKKNGVGLGFMNFFARAVVLGLREFPRVNAFIKGDDIIYHNYVNLGIAVSTDKGLAVPVLKHAETMSFAKIESEIKRLAAAVRDGKLALSELSGGTFTITNGGVFGSLLSTPILNPPQSGILGMHAINKRPMAINDKVEIRPMMFVALSYDHRMVDGRDSVSFLVRLKEYLEDPARLMLEI